MNVNRSNEKKCFHTNKRQEAESIIDPDYADGLLFLANTPSQAESLLDSQEQAMGGTSLYMNSDKTEFMCFNQDGVPSLKGKPLR